MDQEGRRFAAALPQLSIWQKLTMNPIIVLAEELFQRRLESYWKSSENSVRSSINESSAREWMNDCLKLAEIIKDQENQYYTKK